MPNLVNTLVVDELQREFSEAEGMVLVAFKGLTMPENEALRDSIAEAGASFRMVRNSLAKRVLKERGIEFEEGALKGNTAIAYGNAEQTILAAKALTEKEVKKLGKVKLKAGVMEGRVLGPSDAAALANIPDRDTLRAQLLGCISGPARGLATVINGTPSGLARVLQAHADKGEEA